MSAVMSNALADAHEMMEIDQLYHHIEHWK